MLTFNETIRPVLADAAGAPIFFASTGTFTGVVSGVSSGEDQQDDRH
jgi:hypothetical protein